MNNLLLEQPLVALITLLATGLGTFLMLAPERINLLRAIALSVSLAALAIGLVTCLNFDKTLLGFQFLYRLNVLPDYNFTITFGVDGLGFLFTLLTLFVFPICFLASWSVTQNPKQFLAHLLLMELLLVLTFTTTDLLYFFIFFESLLIPMFMLIGSWGARERKIKAAYYFFLYTLFGSLFMLFGIFYIYFLTGSTNYNVILHSALQPGQQNIIWFCFFLAFAVKMPLFPVHIWLPEAHVEAPTVGSMLLASLLLKLGGYGFLRFSVDALVAGAFHFLPHVAVIALLGVIYGSLSTIRQIDMKRVIAYSSVAHMNLVMLGLFSYSQQGIEGAVYLMVAHGVVSTALFFCVGVLYDRHHTRLFRYYGGLVLVMPLFASAFFAFTLANMSFPGTSNFIGELLIFVGIFSSNEFVTIFAASGIVLAAVYSIWLYNRVCFGTMKTTHINRFSDLNLRESAIFLTLLLPMVLLGLISAPVLDFTHFSVQALLLAPFLTIAGRKAAQHAPTGLKARPYTTWRFLVSPSEETLMDLTSFRKLRFAVGIKPQIAVVIPTIFCLLVVINTFLLYLFQNRWFLYMPFGTFLILPPFLKPYMIFIYQWGASLFVAFFSLAIMLSTWYALSLWRATIRFSSRVCRHLKHLKESGGILETKKKRQYLGMIAKSWFDIQQYTFYITYWLYIASLFAFVFLLHYTLFSIGMFDAFYFDAIEWFKDTFYHISTQYNEAHEAGKV